MEQLSQACAAAFRTVSSHLSVVQFVKQFLEKGNSVVATARTPSRATDLQKLAEKHDKLMLTEVDVTSMDSIKVQAHAGRPVHDEMPTDKS